MGIGQKVKQVVDKITPGHHTHEGRHAGEPGYEPGLTSAGYEPGLTETGTTGTTGYPTTAAGTTGMAGYGATTTGTDIERTTEEAAAEKAAATGQPAVAETVTTAAAAPTARTTAGEGAVCDAEHFTVVEDRPVVKERVEYVKEHRPVEKEYVVETRVTGAERAHAGQTEHLGTTERVVSEATPKAPCE